MGKKRNIKVGEDITISGERKPKSIENPDSYLPKHPSWNFSKSDLLHTKWSLVKSDFFNEILPKLINFERRTWGDIVSDKKHNHWIDTGDFIKEAQDRLIELKIYYDQLFSLHLTGKMRLFGYIEDGIYYIIWYDANHEICPSHKKHT